MKNMIMTMLLFSLIVLSCQSNKSSVGEKSVEGKQVESIKHYTIHFDDGTTYDMGEKTASKIYYLIRHAEKDTFPKGNPQLSKAGEQRAEKLAEIFEGTQLDALYSTLTTRTLFTVSEVADSKGLTTFPYEVKDFKSVADKISKSLQYHRNLIVGHSNSAPVMANYLYGKEYFNQVFDESDYSNLVVIIEDINKNKKLLALKY